MKIEIKEKKNLIPALWNGGETYEYFISPGNAVYGERNFDFRISSATIEKAPSEFTRFQGYDRYLVMLDSELVILRNSAPEKYKNHEIFCFNSDDHIISSSTGNDFNLMIKSSEKKADTACSTEFVSDRKIWCFFVGSYSFLCSDRRIQRWKTCVCTH